MKTLGVTISIKSIKRTDFSCKIGKITVGHSQFDRNGTSNLKVEELYYINLVINV